jgi:hypothetical protein
MDAREGCGFTRPKGTSMRIRSKTYLISTTRLRLIRRLHKRSHPGGPQGFSSCADDCVCVPAVVLNNIPNWKRRTTFHAFFIRSSNNFCNDYPSFLES